MNGDELVKAVGSVLNIGVPDSNTTPTDTDIVDWLNFAQDMIARNVPADDLQTLFDTVDGSLGLPKNALRVVAVTIDDQYYAKWVPHYEYLRLKATIDEDPDKAVWAYGPTELSNVPTTVDEYTGTADDVIEIGNISSGLKTGACQSFQSTNEELLDTVTVSMKKTGDFALSLAPLQCYIYDLDGTYGGGDDIPLGLMPIASAYTLVNALDTNFSDITFQFAGSNQITLEAGTSYVVAVVVPTLDDTHWVEVETDASSPTHTGNAGYLDGPWTALPDEDMIFEVTGLEYVWDEPQALSIVTYPVSATDNYEVVTLTKPMLFDNTATRFTRTVPVIYDQVLVLSAVAMARMQDEEMQDTQYLFMLLGTMLGRGTLPDEAVPALQGMNPSGGQGG